MVKPIRPSFLSDYFINFYNFFVHFTPLTKNRRFYTFSMVRVHFQCFSSILQRYERFFMFSADMRRFRPFSMVFVYFASLRAFFHRYRRFYNVSDARFRRFYMFCVHF